MGGHTSCTLEISSCSDLALWAFWSRELILVSQNTSKKPAISQFVYRGPCAKDLNGILLFLFRL